MSRALLDVNVLIALIDANHVSHERAHSWAARELDHGWATCAITQAGVVRILSQPRYPQHVAPAEAIALVRQAVGTKSHEYWTCDVPVVDAVDPAFVLGHRQVTDAYLLALAVHNDGRLVTFDGGINPATARGGAKEHLYVL